jgi:hypothetical protein
MSMPVRGRLPAALVALAGACGEGPGVVAAGCVAVVLGPGAGGVAVVLGPGADPVGSGVGGFGDSLPTAARAVAPPLASAATASSSVAGPRLVIDGHSRGGGGDHAWTAALGATFGTVKR